MIRKDFLMREVLLGLIILFIGFLLPSQIGAAEYPTKPIELIAPFSPGGVMDIVGRLVSQNSNEYLGQPMVVLNKPGAGGLLGMDYVAKAKADGYTLVTSGTGVTVILPAVKPDTPYNPVKGFTQVCNLVHGANVILVREGSPLDTIEKLIDYGKKNPGKLNYGAPLGSSMHLGAELFTRAVGIQMTHVPFKGTAPSMAALLGGHIDLIFCNYIGAVEQIKAGKVIPLAVTSAERESDLPQVPTLVEKGYPNVVITFWVGIEGPPGIPKPVVDRLNWYFQKVLASSDFQKKIKTLGVTPAHMPPDEFGKFVQSEFEKYRRAAKEANIKLE